MDHKPKNHSFTLGGLMTNRPIHLDSVVRRTNEIVTGNIQNEIVMMSIENGKYYGMNPVGSRIWELIENKVKVSSLCKALQKEFDVQSTVCRSEVLTFLNTLYAKNLLSIDATDRPK